MNLTYTTNLEPGIYDLVKFKADNQAPQYVLQTSKKEFDTPKRIYGEYLETVDHIFSYYKMSNATMGCLFHGEPGAGKSLTSELLCNLAVRNGMPVIYVQGMRGDKTNTASELIEMFKNFRNVAVYIDEFGKMFSTSDQYMFLSILSDSSANNLWILTENEEKVITKYISKRAGRIRYNIEFNKISERAVREYCDEMRVSPTFLEQLMDKYDSTDMFTFDQLKALVSEELFNLSRYGTSKPIDEVCMLLNVKDVLTTYVLKIREIKYLGHVLEKERVDAIRCSFDCRLLRVYSEKTLPVTSRDYAKLLSAPSKVEVSIRVGPEAYSLFTESDIRGQVRSLKETLDSDLRPDKRYIEDCTGSIKKEIIDGIERSFIAFIDTYFEITLGLYTKNGDEIFLK